jgi:hypothetical protein
MAILLSILLPRVGRFRAAGKYHSEDASENEFFDE